MKNFDKPILKQKKYKFEPYCTSYDCRSKSKKEDLGEPGIKKIGLKKSDTWCPHCEYALYWKRTEV